MPVVYFEIKWISYLLVKRVTQLSLSSRLAAVDEKLSIIFLWGGKPLFVSCLNISYKL
jgi:hypothetical protein